MDKPIPHILIVDDDPNQLEILHEFLKRKGFQPVSAQSGSAALALIEDERMDVALIDLQLGDMSGLDVLRGIKERSPKTECILLTGHASQKTAIEAIQLGVYGYFQKPFDIEQVHLFIQRAVEKQAVENALHESETRYRDLVENSQDLICTHDLQGNLLFVNEAGTKISGHSNETLLKMNLREILAPETRRLFDAYLAEIQAQGQAHGLMRIQTAGGEIRYLEFKNTLQTEGLTTPIARGMARDVTERKQAEDALRASEANLKEAQRVGRIGSWDWDATTDIIHWSEEYYRIYCLDPSQPPPGYEEHLKVYAAESAARLDAAVKNSMQTGSPYELDLEYVCADGARRWVTARSEIKRDAKDQIVGLRGTALDITKRKQAEEEIRQRVTELETLNHVSVVLRTIASQDQMLAIVLEETLKALHAENGSIQLWNKATNRLHKSMARGWPAEVTELPQEINEGIAGRVFSGGGNYVSRDMLNDPITRAAARSQLPPGWGGICVPLRSAEQPLGTLFIAIPSERELNKGEVRLLNTLAEMTGASLHRMSLYEEAVRRMKDLQALRDVDQAITSNFDLRPTLDTVITHAIAQLGVDAADILLLRPHLKFLEYAAGHGFRTPLAKGASVRLGESLAGRAALERRTIHISNLADTHANAGFAAFWKSEGFAAYFCAPLLAKGEVKGVLEVYQRKPLPSEPEWLSYLETLAGQAAIAIDSTQLFDSLQRANLELGIAYETTIESWSRALSLRDSETEGHTQRITEMSTALARSFNFNEEELQHIRRGAILHDIGKMGVPDQILLKPGPLTDEEWIIVRGHPQVAYDVLKPIAYLRDSLDIPYCHHENWDGSGYPRGLAGENIPLTARIFAIVDVYDTLTNDRPYRKAWSNEKALEYIREQSGKRFDPQVVNAFLLEFGRKRSIVSGRPGL